MKLSQRYFWMNPFKKESLDKQVFNAWCAPPLLLGLPANVCAKLVSSTHVRRYQPGEHIFREGDRAVAAALIIQGSVFIRSNDKEIACLESGEFFGEAALLEDSPRSASAVAEGVTLVSLLVRYQFEAFIRHRPQAGLDIMGNLARLLLARLHLSNISHNGNDA